MAQAAIAAEIHQALDVHGDVASQVALDPVVAVDDLAQTRDLGVGQLVDPRPERDVDLAQDLLGRGPADAVDVRRPIPTGLPLGMFTPAMRATSLLLLVPCRPRSARLG